MLLQALQILFVLANRQNFELLALGLQLTFTDKVVVLDITVHSSRDLRHGLHESTQVSG